LVLYSRTPFKGLLMTDTTTAVQHDVVLEAAGTLDTISRAAREGAADAREMANRVWASTSLFLSRFVYTTSYTLSYGVVFPATLIARSVPRDNAAVRGLIDGARVATEKVYEIKGIKLDEPLALTVDEASPTPSASKGRKRSSKH
jgi:hypothetical protein